MQHRADVRSFVRSGDVKKEFFKTNKRRVCDIKRGRDVSQIAVSTFLHKSKFLASVRSFIFTRVWLAKLTLGELTRVSSLLAANLKYFFIKKRK